MENFTNEIIDTKQLPRYEEVQLTPLHHKYWNVMLINIAIFLSILGIAIVLILRNVRAFSDYGIAILTGFAIVILFTFFLNRIGFKKKSYAFRTHDVIYRCGIIATNTRVIPYNRVQHVAIHEGFVSRIFGLAKVEIFTAGGNSSDIEISGIAKEEAENIKQLLMGKIQKQL